MRLKHAKVKEPCFNIIFENENITIPEIDDTDFLNFGLTFMKIQEREMRTSTNFQQIDLRHSKSKTLQKNTDNLKIAHF